MITEERLTELEARSDAGELLPREVPALLAEIRRLRFHLGEVVARVEERMPPDGGFPTHFGGLCWALHREAKRALEDRP